MKQSGITFLSHPLRLYSCNCTQLYYATTSVSEQYLLVIHVCRSDVIILLIIKIIML